MAVELGLVVCVSWICVAPVSGADDWGKLAEQCRQELDSFRPIDPQLAEDDLVSARQSLQAAEEYLASMDGADAESWREKLKLDQLAQTLSVSLPDADRVRGLTIPFYGLDVGLEADALLELRQALDNLQRRLRVTESPDLARAEFRRRMAAVADSLDQEHPDALTIGGHLVWLSAAGQAPEFVEAVKRKFRHPNVMVEVSRPTIEMRLAEINQDVDQTEFVSTMIQGAEVSGEARFQATVTAELAADTTRAEIEIQVSGQVSAADNVAVRRPFILYTSSTAEVEASTRVHWDGLRFQAATTAVEAALQSQIHHAHLMRRGDRNLRLLNPGSRLISRLALSRAERQRADAEYEAARHMEQRIGEQIDEFVGSKLAEWNEQVDKSLVAPLTRLGLLPDIQARTGDSRIVLDVTQSGAAGLSAPAGPSWPPLDGILALSLHETALPDFLTPSAADARWSDQRFAKIQKQLLGVNSYEFRLGLHPRWEVVLDSQRPLATQIDEQSLGFEFNVQELILAGTCYRYPFRVAAHYHLEPTTTVLKLERQGQVELTWTGAPAQQPPADEQSRLRRFLLETFSGFFLAEAYTDGLSTPAGGDWAAVSDLRMSRVDLQPGWLRMTFNRSPAITSPSTRASSEIATGTD